MNTNFNSVVVVALLAVMSGGVAAASEQTREQPRVERKGPLAELPSKPGAHLEKIKALGNNQWLNLGSPAADPEWGKSRGRSWSSNIPYVPEYEGAFLSGAGRHGFVKPDGRFQGDDLWFYDRNAHRWICVYPGVEVKTLAQRIRSKELTVDEKTGLLVHADGQPLPPYATHNWQLMGYDTDRKEFVNLFTQQISDYFTAPTLMAEAWELFRELRGKRTFPPLSPMFYNVPANRWSCVPVNAAPRAVTVKPYHKNLLYIGSMKKFFFGGPSGVWFYDRATNRWTQAKVHGEKLPDVYDSVACYDSKRHRVYYGARANPTSEALYVFDLSTNAWSRLQPKGDAPHFFGSPCTVFYYDSVSDVVVVFSYGKRHWGNPVAWKEGVYVYDPVANTWSGPQPFPAGLRTDLTFSTFFDPEMNAAFTYVAGDSRDDGSMWVYRYKKATE